MGTCELNKIVNHNNENLLYIKLIGLSRIKTNSSAFQYSVKCYYKTIKNSKTIFGQISRKPFDISETVLTEKTIFSSASKIVTFTFNSHNKILNNQKLFLNFQIFNKTKHIICDQCILIFPKVNLLSKDTTNQTDKDQIEECINKIDKISTFYDDIQKTCDNYLEEHPNSIEKDNREQLRNLTTTLKEYIESNNKVIEKINQFYDNINDGNFLKELLFEKLNLEKKDIKFIRSIKPEALDTLTDIEKLSETVNKYKKIFEDLEKNNFELNSTILKKFEGFYDQIEDRNFLRKVIFEKLNIGERDLNFIRSIKPEVLDTLTDIEKLSEKVSKFKKQFEDYEQTDHLLSIDNVDRKYEY